MKKYYKKLLLLFIEMVKRFIFKYNFFFKQLRIKNEKYCKLDVVNKIYNNGKLKNGEDEEYKN